MRTLIVIAAALGLSACATHETATAGHYGYAEELRDLEAQCDARGGMLRQVRPPTFSPGTDYICRIHDGPSERVRPIAPAAR